MFIDIVFFVALIIFCFQFAGQGEEAHFEGGPYEWWVEGGKKEVEAGQLVGVARAGGLDTEATVYRLRHSYNKPGEELRYLILEILNFDIYTAATQNLEKALLLLAVSSPCSKQLLALAYSKNLLKTL